MTRRGDRQLECNQRKRATDLLTYLARKGYLGQGTVSSGAVNVVQNWLQREHIIGMRAQRVRGRK